MSHYPKTTRGSRPLAKRRSAGARRRLRGRIALVAGATRVEGRGIARALAEAGATVYCTGRSVKGRPSPYKRPETIDETAAIITAAGGTATAVRVDHTDQKQVKALFRRILDRRVHDRTGMLLSSWEVARDYGLSDYDGRRPDWGRHKIDFSVLPAEWTNLFRTGADLELNWLRTLAERTRRFKAKIPT